MMRRKDLEKFIKFLVLKSTQVVVQSRLGEKIQTQCNPLATGTDWFNIVIQDHPDVYAEAKNALGLGPGESIIKRLPLCIEISLKTVEGDQMVLEVWTIDLQTTGLKDRNDTKGGATTNSEQQTLKAAHAIYNKMSILLKSLISLTRATPAYKLSRRQCADSYGIYYRIYVDKPKVHTLGEGYKSVRIGQMNTIVGALTMSVAYRVKMTITPTAAQTRNGDGNTIMVKSDHFRPADASPTPPMLAGKKGSGGGAADRKVIDIEKPLRPGAFTDLGKLRQYTEDDYVLPETPPFEWLLRRTRCESGGSNGEYGSIESLNRKSDPIATSPTTNGHQNLISNNNNNNSGEKVNSKNVNINNNNNNVATFKSFEKDENTQKTTAECKNLSQSPVKSLLIPAPPATRHQSAPILSNTHAMDDDSLLKELNFPFASPNSHVNDLAKFYRDCYHAPPLRGLNEIQPDMGGCAAAAAVATTTSAEAAAVDDLSRQLEQFETSLEDYDKLVSQLGLSTSSSTGSRSSGGLQMSN
ncbi:autophagy-related protein 13 homolog [Teleopsis dalmanni]|uniref:autophagy-related protein 13 homolog n=1 Tax=Teleopsis dalmanni TaxID=139649 RepID=UPI0018CE65FA|nr:autophagy-related protein 13 homolog [Teleopsis dalmanni]